MGGITEGEAMRYDDEYGDPYGDDQRWMTGGELIRLAALDIAACGVVIALFCIAWSLLP
jgi:hypothetical protein